MAAETCPVCGGTGAFPVADLPGEDEVERILNAHPLPADDSDEEILAWYRETFDDDGCPDEMALRRYRSWMRGQSLGPIRHGVPLRNP